MANINSESWRSKDYTSVPQHDEALETFPDTGQVPGKGGRTGSPSWEPSQQNSPLLSAEHIDEDDDDDDNDPDQIGLAHGPVDWSNDREKSKSLFYLFLLTISIGGYGHTPFPDRGEGLHVADESSKTSNRLCGGNVKRIGESTLPFFLVMRES